jgi:large subunit ribosomal protein L9
MKIVLLAHVKKLGQKGDVVNVSEGMFRNMLAPRKLARIASDSNVRHAQNQKAKAVEKLENMKESAQSVREKMHGKIIEMKEKTSGESKLYAAINEVKIAEAIKEQCKVILTPKVIFIPKQIKALGEFDVKLKLYNGIEADLKINVLAQ